MLESDRTEDAARQDRIRKLKARQQQIEERISTMYMDKLDGRITQEFFDQRAATMRQEQAGLQGNIQTAEEGVLPPVDDAL